MQSSKETLEEIRKTSSVINECKEIEENNRIGKTRDLFKKIRDIKGTLHAILGAIKGRNGKGPTEAGNIEKRWQEDTELYKKDINEPDNYDDVIIHLESDIVKCDVKWASEVSL